jgi:hypothetical protein
VHGIAAERDACRIHCEIDAYLAFWHQVHIRTWRISSDRNNCTRISIHLKVYSHGCPARLHYFQGSELIGLILRNGPLVHVGALIADLKMGFGHFYSHQHEPPNLSSISLAVGTFSSG